MMPSLELLADPEAILDLVADADGDLRRQAYGPDLVAAPDAFGLGGLGRSGSNDADGEGPDEKRDGADVGSHRSMIATAGLGRNGGRSFSRRNHE